MVDTHTRAQVSRHKGHAPSHKCLDTRDTHTRAQVSQTLVAAQHTHPRTSVSTLVAAQHTHTRAMIVSIARRKGQGCCCATHTPAHMIVSIARYKGQGCCCATHTPAQSKLEPTQNYVDYVDCPNRRRASKEKACSILQPKRRVDSLLPPPGASDVRRRRIRLPTPRGLRGPAPLLHNRRGRLRVSRISTARVWGRPPTATAIQTYIYIYIVHTLAARENTEGSAIAPPPGASDVRRPTKKQRLYPGAEPAGLQRWTSPRYLWTSYRPPWERSNANCLPMATASIPSTTRKISPTGRRSWTTSAHSKGSASKAYFLPGQPCSIAYLFWDFEKDLYKRIFSRGNPVL